VSRALEANARRRRELQARSAVLRADCTFLLADLARPLGVAHQAQGLWQRLRAKPWWLAAAGAALAALRPRKALGWALKAWGAWRLWRRLRG